MHSFFSWSQQKTQKEKEISVESKFISQLRKKSKGKKDKFISGKEIVRNAEQERRDC